MAADIMQPSDARFSHPYEPYDIQLKFMTSLYDCIESGQVGILESPTGTGKSLSLICGSLTWLRDHKRRALDEVLKGCEDDNGDWLAVAERAARRRELLQEREKLEERLASIRQNEARRKKLQLDARAAKRTRPGASGITPNEEGDDQFALEDYDSGDDITHTSLRSNNGLSTTTLALLDQLKGSAPKSEDSPERDETKIIFCSRTHSQLTQFVHELRRVNPPSSITLQGKVDSETSCMETVKHLPLGSRKNLCINTKVSGLNSTNAINERCLELQRPGTAKEHRCKYLPTKEAQDVSDAFRDRAIAQIQDIEDIAKLGHEMGICPYYASRAAISPSEVLTLPYPLLLQRSAREALGVSVKGNIIVIDEAHNLMDAIIDTFSISMQLSQLHIIMQQVTAYVQRYKSRLKGKNRVYVAQVIRIVNSITDCLTNTAKAMRQNDCAVTAVQLMSGKGVDQIKPHKLLQYLQESKLAHKVEGYADAQNSGNGNVLQKGILMHFQNFLRVLMNPASEGRFFIDRQDNDIVVRYTLLDPREHFRDIVQDARAVILAGGTMSPMSDYVNYLFSYLQPDQLQTFSFGHVIPKDNMLAEAVIEGPTGQTFDFTFDKRTSESIILELGQLVLQVCRVVPDGVVVFFPSYDYLAQVLAVWKNEVTRPSIMESLSQRKRTFEEVKGISVDELLREYSQAIDSGNGGLMLSVVGGKLSEGINFSDRLGRAVVAVGLPFPNANSAEWKAKIEHVEGLRYGECREQQKMSETDAKVKAKAAGREFYENACMRAVNQSIGRAIRHKNDYAAILMVDRRFATDRIRAKLPGWIQDSMKPNQSQRWIEIESNLRAFFIGKQ